VYRFLVKVAVPLIVSGVLSVWIASADAEMANSARLAATSIPKEIQNRPGRVIFQGHWGFQYYMELLGFTPLDVTTYQPWAEDLMIIPMTAPVGKLGLVLIHSHPHSSRISVLDIYALWEGAAMGRKRTKAENETLLTDNPWLVRVICPPVHEHPNCTMVRCEIRDRSTNGTARGEYGRWSNTPTNRTGLLLKYRDFTH
jgi:hypothetical protein